MVQTLKNKLKISDLVQAPFQINEVSFRDQLFQSKNQKTFCQINLQVPL